MDCFYSQEGYKWYKCSRLKRHSIWMNQNHEWIRKEDKWATNWEISVLKYYKSGGQTFMTKYIEGILSPLGHSPAAFQLPT